MLDLDNGTLRDERAYLVDAGNNLTGYSQTLAEINVLTGAVSVYNTFTDRVAGQTTVTGSSTSQQLLQHDPLGSVRGVSTGTPGAWSHNRVDYTAFGTPFIPGTSTPIERNGEPTSVGPDPSFVPGAEGSLTSFAFTGERRDQVRQYHRARWLTPTRGSWLSQDPVFDWPAGLGKPLAYVVAGITTQTDPSGEIVNLAETTAATKMNSQLRSSQIQIQLQFIRVTAPVPAVTPPPAFKLIAALVRIALQQFIAWISQVLLLAQLSLAPAAQVQTLASPIAIGSQTANAASLSKTKIKAITEARPPGKRPRTYFVHFTTPQAFNAILASGHISQPSLGATPLPGIFLTMPSELLFTRQQLAQRLFIGLRGSSRAARFILLNLTPYIYPDGSWIPNPKEIRGHGGTSTGALEVIFPKSKYPQGIDLRLKDSGGLPVFVFGGETRK